MSDFNDLRGDDGERQRRLRWLRYWHRMRGRYRRRDPRCRPPTLATVVGSDAVCSVCGCPSGMADGLTATTDERLLCHDCLLDSLPSELNTRGK